MNKVDRVMNGGDILSKILSRIPVRPLLGLKCISREWHRLISSLISSRPYVKAHLENTELVLTGFIFQENCSKDFKAIYYIPVERRNAEVPKLILDFLPEDVVVLASSKGLICCRSCLPSPQRQPAIHVCNPITKQCIQIQWPAKYDRNDCIALAFDLCPSKDSIDMCSKFKLVRVNQFKEYSTFEIYSSETVAWNESKEICRHPNMLIKNKGVHIGGILHWLTDGGQVLTFDVENELSGLISEPIYAFLFMTVPETCIGESEGKLHYVHASEEGLQVWLLEKCDMVEEYQWSPEDVREYKWELNHWKKLEDIDKEYPQFHFNLTEQVGIETSPLIIPLCFMDGLLLMKVWGNPYLYDIKSNKMTRVGSIEDLNSKSTGDPTVLPHSLSLVPLSHA